MSLAVQALTRDIAVERDVCDQCLDAGVVSHLPDEAGDDDAHVDAVEVGPELVQHVHLDRRDGGLVEVVASDRHHHRKDDEVGGGLR